jgi:LPS export ABC transporter protein LptC
MTPARPAPPAGARRAIALAAACAALAAGCAERSAPQPEEQPALESPEQVSRGFVVTRSEGGRKVWDLKAATGEIYGGGDVVLLSDLSIDFYDSSGAVDGSLTAASGKVLRAENRLEAQASVVLEGAGGATLRTEHLFWSDDSNRITTDDYVEIDRGDERLTGYGLRASPDLSFAEVTREVTIRGSREAR